MAPCVSLAEIERVYTGNRGTKEEITVDYEYEANKVSRLICVNNSEELLGMAFGEDKKGNQRIYVFRPGKTEIVIPLTGDEAVAISREQRNRTLGIDGQFMYPYKDEER